MKSVLSFLAGLALLSANAWAGGVGINLKMKKNGVLRFAVVGDFAGARCVQPRTRSRTIRVDCGFRR